MSSTKITHTRIEAKLTASQARAIGALAVGMIQRQVNAGTDIDGKEFARYSDSYQKFLRDVGEGLSVDLRMTGGLMASVKVLQVDVLSDDKAKITIGPGTGTSARVVAPSKGKARMRRTGARGPSHNVLGSWLHNGTTRMPARKWLGLDERHRREIIEDILRFAVRMKR